MPTEKELTDDIFFDNSVFVEKKMSKESSKKDQIYKPQNEKTSNEELKDGVALVLSNKNEAIVIESLIKYEADTNLLNELNVPEPDTANSGTEIHIEALPEILDSNHQVEDIKPSITLKNSSSQENTSHVNNKEISKNVRGILMTPKTFLSIPENVKIQKFNNFNIDTKEKLEMVVGLIFVKAASDLVFSLEYAKICHWIIDYLKKSVIDLTSNEEVTFNRILINKCQEFKLLLDKSKTLNIDSEVWYSETFGKLSFIVDLFKSKIHGHDKEDSDHTKAYHQEDLDHTKAKKDPHFEKKDASKLKNACIQSDDFIKDLQRKEQKEKDELARNIQGILNKLTPQKFISLLDKMKELKIDTKEKLEIAIDLIFEKAVSEPVFSVAYASLCHRLVDCFKQPMIDNSTPSDTITFRRILLNKCQKEFDKGRSDEKLLEEDKNKSFDTEAESKLWKAELDQHEIMNRRMLGIIRFIGELFKLKMIAENIMHDCVIKLLKCELGESAEDQLEWLCKLLATIGKDLDHPKAKFRVDQYFTQMTKIIDRKKISTRIKFAIKDIIDLRSCSWVPRRDDSNPKTIEQIHKEAKDEEKDMKKMMQQDKMRPKERGAQRSIGHDSPAMRGNVTEPPSSADGGTNIPSKSKNFPATPVDASKFKIAKKDDSENISLGPGGYRSNWSRGASGGGSRSSSGAPTSAEPVQHRQTNRYDLLSEQVQPSGFDSKRGSRGSNTSRSSGGKSSREDRIAVIRAVQNITTNKNQFSKHSQNDRDSPRSGAQTPKLVENISEEDIRKKTISTINEYLSIRDTNEAIACLKEVNCSYLHYMFVEEAITIVIEMKSEERKSIGALLHDMIIQNVITVDQLCKGLTSIVQNAPDYAVDIPHFYKYLGEVIGPMVYDGALPLNRVKDTLEPLVKPNKAGDVMAEALSVAVDIAGKEELVSELWSKSNIKWEMLLNNDENIDKFIKDKKMEFLMNSTSSNKSHLNIVRKGLLRILHEKGDNNKITSYIDSEGGNCKSDPYFIKDLSSMICKSTLIDGPSNTCNCNKIELEKRKNILSRYIDGNKNLELFALYGIQQLVTALHHPIGLAILLFQELYSHDIISEETFFTWESSKDFPDGKGNTISSVKDFLSWLRKAEEESNEEDSTNVFN